MSGVRHTLKHTIQLPLGAVMAATMCVAGGACFLALASTTQVLPRTIVAVGMFLAATLLTVTSALYLTDRLGREQRERERVERCLREALDALRCQKLALDAHAIVSETDADGWITYVNDRFCAISGFTRAEVIGQNHRCLNSAHHPRQFWADMYAKVAKDGIWHSEICNRAKDGSLYWEETTVVAFRDQRGKLARYVSVRTDITERKRAQAEAAKQRAHLELFVEHVPAPVAMFDREMRYIGHSRRWLTDYRLQDGIIGKSHYEVFPEIPERWKVIHRRCLAGAVERNDEDCFVRADGSRQWLRWEVRPWFMPDGQIGGIVMFTEDISESRAAAEKIAQSERLLRTILDVLPQRVFWKDRQGRYGGANQRFLADCGMSEVVGKDDYDMPWTREQSDFFRTCDQRVMETGVPEIEIIEPLSDAAGAAKWLSTSKVPLCNDAGEVVGVLGTSLDITRLKQLERDAEERLARLESAEAIARIGHWTWDPSTPQGHGSRQLYRLFGRDADRDTLSYAEVLALLVPQDSERLDAAVRRAVERGAGFGLQLQLRQEANGCEFLWVQAQVERDAQGKVQGLCGTTMDITERVRRERDLERARTAAEEGSRAKSEFLAAMSHEIRTPMNGVLGFTHLLLESSLDAEQRDFATTIKKSAEALLTIINDILDYSKIEAGKLTLEMVPCDILGAACDVVDLLEYRAVEKGLELALQADTDAMPQLIVDPGRVRQVLLNLVGNAIKFTADGHVLVELRTFRGSETEPGCVRVSVTDTGIGIPAAKQQLLFARFSQADSSTTRRFGGTGLGLAISKQLVELMGGSIGVESDSGRGSTFWFTLPLPLDPAAGTGADAPSAPSSRVLIADDAAVNRHVLECRLRHWRIDHAAVGSAGEAEAELRRAAAAGTPFDLVMIDQFMPGGDGPQLARAIRADAALGDPAIVLMISSSRRAAAAAIERALWDALLLKPVARPLLVREAMQEALALRARRREVPGEPPQAGVAAAPPAGSDRPRSEAPPPTIAGARVLLAEDVAVNQKLATAFLKRLGLVVEVAHNGLEAIDLFKARHFDLILMDCLMPDMDGYHATTAIRQLETARAPAAGAARIPIVALTANALQGDRERCLQAGMDDYLAKPLQFETLARVVRHWVRSQSPMRPQP